MSQTNDNATKSSAY